MNNSHRVVDSGVVPLAISDHSLIYGIFKSGVPKAPPRIVEHRTYKQYNKSAFIKDISEINWSVIDGMDVDSGVNLLNTLFSNVANSHAPIKKTGIKGIPAPWMTSELSQLMHDRDYHHTKAVKSNSKHHWSKYRKLRQAVNKRVKECKASYYKDLIEKSSRNSGESWRTLNGITCRKDISQPSFIQSNGIRVTDPKSIACLLNEHFITVGSNLAEKFQSLCRYFSNRLKSASKHSGHLNDFSFTPESETFVLKQLKT